MMKKPTAERMADQTKPRVIGFMGCSSSVRDLTMLMPIMEVMTPTPRMSSGNMIHTSATFGSPCASARIMLATSVTS